MSARRRKNFFQKWMSIIQRWDTFTPAKRQRFFRVYMARALVVIVALILLFLAGRGVVGIYQKFFGKDDAAPVSTESEAPPQTETSEKKETQQQTATATVTITAAGDCVLANESKQKKSKSFVSYYETYGEEYFFDSIRGVLESDDLTLVNLECVFSDSGEAAEKDTLYRSPASYVGILTSSSIEAVSLGNNHTMDYGEQGFLDTKKALSDAGVVYGVGDEIGYFTSKDGVKVAILSQNLVSYSEDKERVLLDGIAAAKKNANVVVVCCHWGKEGKHEPKETQVNVAHRLVDAGADLVIGTHPQVLQGVEHYKGKIICYSLGNFCFGGSKEVEDMNTMMFRQTFTIVNGEIQPNIEAMIIPGRISSQSGINDYQSAVAVTHREEIIDQVNGYCKSIGNVTFDNLGYIRIDGQDPMVHPVTEAN